MARVALVEAWYRGSHRAWADQVANRSRHDVALVTHPGVHWRWRMQGGSVTLARDLAAVGDVDVVLATSAVDLASLLGLARRHVAQAPAILYLHENQVTHPLGTGEPRDLTYAMATWRSLVAADLVLCNSRHHLDELADALPRFLDRFPDEPHAPLLPDVLARTRVLHPGVALDRLPSGVASHVPAGVTAAGDGRVRILWNHRWERDKRPDRFVAAVERLAGRTDGFVVDVVGSHARPENMADELAPIRHLVDRLGHLDDEAYTEALGAADVVVSTAEHEYFGIAVVEAVAAGAVPVLPHALAYPEVLPGWAHRDCLYADDAGLDQLLRRAVTDADRRRDLAARLAPAMARFDAATAVAGLDTAVDEVLAGRSRPR